MDEFIDKVAWGLNAVFSNGVGYPRTRWLVLDGANNERAFKAFLRNRQIPTQVWYSAYDELSTINIENNAAIQGWLDRGRAPSGLKKPKPGWPGSDREGRADGGDAGAR